VGDPSGGRLARGGLGEREGEKTRLQAEKMSLSRRDCREKKGVDRPERGVAKGVG